MVWWRPWPPACSCAFAPCGGLPGTAGIWAPPCGPSAARACACAGPGPGGGGGTSKKQEFDNFDQSDPLNIVISHLLQFSQQQGYLIFQQQG